MGKRKVDKVPLGYMEVEVSDPDVHSSVDTEIARNPKLRNLDNNIDEDVVKNLKKGLKFDELRKLVGAVRMAKPDAGKSLSNKDTEDEED